MQNLTHIYHDALQIIQTYANSLKKFDTTHTPHKRQKDHLKIYQLVNNNTELIDYYYYYIYYYKSPQLIQIKYAFLMLALII